MDILDFGKQLILDAGAFIRERMEAHYRIDSKLDPDDLVTDVDKETEKFIIERIKRNFSDHKIIGEEGTSEPITQFDGVVWVIDPIDGTMNFVHQGRNFAISIGVYIDEVPHAGFILDVMTNDLYHGIRGEGAYYNDIRLESLNDTQVEKSIVGLNPKWMLVDDIKMPFIQTVSDVRQTRNYGSAALEFAYVASGQLEGTIFWRLSPWDFAAGHLLIEEVGGTITDLLGEPLSIRHNSSVLAGNNRLHSHIVGVYKQDESFKTAHHNKFNI